MTDPVTTTPSEASQNSNGSPVSLDAVPQDDDRPPLNTFGLSPEIYFKVVEQAPIAISITDTKARILYANAAFTKVTGFSFEEVKGCNESVLSDRRTPSIVYESLWSSLIRHRAWSGKLLNRRKNGARYLAELMVAPVRDEDNNTIHYLGMHRNVTEQHVLEQAVKNQQALIESLLDSAPTWFVAMDESLNVALSNAAFKEADALLEDASLAELMRTAVCGDSDEKFIELRSARAPMPQREAVVQLSGEPSPRRIIVETRWLDESDSSADAFFKSGGQRYFLMFGTDVTSLRQQQEHVQTNALRALVAEEERVQELHEILNAAVFRFQLPLNLLTTALRLAENTDSGGIANQTLIHAVRDAVREGSELLNRLRDAVPDIPEEPVEQVSVSEIIHDVLRLSTPRLMAEDIVVDMNVGQLPLLQGRRGRIRVLVKELIDNAIEAMGTSDERSILVEAAERSGKLVISISDSGPGIPNSLHYKIFEPFFSLMKNKPDGAGMGLARAQHIVTQHSGVVYVDPSYTDGCRMTVELPLGAQRPQE